jgi:hypothetical protein
MEHILYCLDISQAHKCLGGFLTIIASVVLSLFCAVAFARGTYSNLHDIFGFHGVVTNFFAERKPYNKNENALSVIIADLSTEPDKWQFTYEKNERSGKSLAVSNGPITVLDCTRSRYGNDDFWGYYGPTLRVKGVGEYRLSDVRPRLIAEFARAVENLRSDRATNALMEHTNLRLLRGETA